MINEKLVSVIVPTFNRTELLLKTITSALRQSYKNFEIIVVDDGSSIKPKKLVQENFGDSVICLEKENGGPASARNLGITHAKGEYIAFLDADDLWLPDKLELQISYMEENPRIGLTFTKALVFTESESGRLTDIDLLSYSGEVNLRTLLLGSYIPACTVVVRKSCLDTVGLFDESRELVGTEDYELWLRVAAQYEIGYLPMALSRYRSDSSSLTGGLTLKVQFNNSFTVIKTLQRKMPDLLVKLFDNENMYYSMKYERCADQLYGNKEYSESIRYLLTSLRYKIRIIVVCKIFSYALGMFKKIIARNIARA
jgi:glycosyltransferase involved in cell wall biosynthesis